MNDEEEIQKEIQKDDIKTPSAVRITEDFGGGISMN